MIQVKRLLQVSKKPIYIIRYYVSASSSVSNGNSSTSESKTSASNSQNWRINSQRVKMSGWQIHNYGDLDELQFSDKLKIPQLGCTSHCLVRVRSTSVNPIDVAMLGGYGAQALNVMRCQPQAGIEFPLTLGREFCGELVQRGMGVRPHLTLGQRVWGVVPFPSHGAHAEYVVVPDYCLSQAPKNLSDAEAASVLYAGLTAWSGLYITGRLGGICGAMTSSGGGAHKRVLVLGGSGAVGSLAVQMLKSQNVQVVATCSSDAVEMVHGIGADVVVDYKIDTQLQELSRYAPYDIVLDCAGQGAEKSKSLNIQFNQYITFSAPLLRNIDNNGLAMGMLRNVADLLQSNFQSLSQQGGLIKWGFFMPAPHGIQFLQGLVDRQKLLPLVDSTYKFEELTDAFKKVQSGHLRGKVVVNVV